MFHRGQSIQAACEQERAQPRFSKWLVVLAAVALTVSAFAMQDTPSRPARKAAGQGTRAGTARKSTGNQPAASKPKKTSPEHDMAQMQALLPDFLSLIGKLQTIKFPPPRFQSRLLPLLPDSTQVYFSLPNLSDAAQQAREIVRKQLEESPEFRNWWQDMQKGSKGSLSLDEALDRVHQVFDYLGDELTIGLSFSGKDAKNITGVAIAQVKKPGLREALQAMAASGDKKSDWRIFTPEELKAATDDGPDGRVTGHDLLLVRPDFVISTDNLALLQRLNEQLDSGGGRFDTTAFGQRMSGAYQGGAGFLSGLDLQHLIDMRPRTNEKDEAALQQSGFADVKYLVMEHKDVNGQGGNRTELSFNGPRHGVASWLGASGTMGGLDFVSPDVMMAVSLLLKSPAAIFDDVKALAEASKPGSTQNVDQMQTAFGLNLKDDLLSKLTGEITIALQDVSGPEAAWTVALKTNDANGLQKTMERLMAFVGMSSGGNGPAIAQESDSGHTYYSVSIPNPQKPMQVSYTYVNGYMLVGSSKSGVMEAIRLHERGRSLAKLGGLGAMLPQDIHEVSALIYQTKSPFMMAMLEKMSPGISQQMAQNNTPTAVWARGEESSISAGSNNPGFDIGMIGVIAGIAIPNFMVAKTAATESAAASSMRTINTAQVTYSTIYKNRGYAPNLATLGPGTDANCQTGTATHACLLDADLGCSTGAWCEKNGYRYKITAPGTTIKRTDYVAVATPVDASAGKKSFCSTTDVVVRFKAGPPLTAPVTVAQCLKWEPL